MLLESEYHSQSTNTSGTIELVCGCMFSGKTEELMRRLRRAKIAKQKVEIFKPILDSRYHNENIVSHDENAIRSTPVQFANDILLLSENCKVVGIDEVQFFDNEIVNVANKLANKGKRVILAGLDMDFLGKPFYPTSELMAIAEFVTKMHAVCVKCGNLASHSYRISDSSEKVLLGETNIYEARCRSCFNDGMESNKDQKSN